VAVLVLATAAAYTCKLGSAPPYLAADETHFATHAGSLASSGTDLNGNRWPLFFRITDPLAAVDRMHVWYQPFLFYVLTLSFWVQPVSEWSLRVPVALIGVVNVLLMFLVGRRLFRSNVLGSLAAALLAMTPAHFLFSRIAADYLCPLPFVLGWLWLVVRFTESRRSLDLAAAAFVLGCGVYSYISAWFVMPLLAVLTAAAARPPRRDLLLAGTALVLPTLVLLPFQSTLAVVLSDVVSRYRLGSPGSTAGPSDGLANFALTERVALLWDYFNPSFLFFAGGNDLLMATSRAGVFLLPMVVLMAAGTYELARRWSGRGLLLLGGLVAAPLPIVIALPEAPSSSTGRMLVMLIFGVLVATVGIEAMWQRSTTAARTAVIVLLAAMPIQFVGFRADYFANYLERSWMRFDPNATRDVVTAVMALDRQEKAPLVVLQDDGDNKSIRWRFYTLRNGADDLWSRTRYFEVGDIASVESLPPRSLLLMRGNDPRSAALLAAGCSKVATVAALDGQPATDIFRRDR
jgi:4-amino-4-deoxy-L-arabinose transferase-like glycosyltransferase